MYSKKEKEQIVMELYEAHSETLVKYIGLLINDIELKILHKKLF